MATTSVHEADGVSEGDVAEGGELPGRSVAKRHGQALGRAVGAAVKLRHHHRRRRHRNGAVIAIMVSSIVNMKGVTGDDNHAKAGDGRSRRRRRGRPRRLERS